MEHIHRDANEIAQKSATSAKNPDPDFSSLVSLLHIRGLVPFIFATPSLVQSC
jgi:hypothetical protein